MIVLNEGTKSQEMVVVLDSIASSFVSYSSDCALFDVKFGSGLVKIQHDLDNENPSQPINCSFFVHDAFTNQTSKFPVRIKVTTLLI